MDAFGYVQTAAMLGYYLVLSLHHDWINPVVVGFQEQRAEEVRETARREEIRRARKAEREARQRERA